MSFKPSMVHQTFERYGCRRCTISLHSSIFLLLGIHTWAIGWSLNTMTIILFMNSRQSSRLVYIIPKISCKTINKPLVLVHAKTSPRLSSGRIIRGLPLFCSFVRSKHDMPEGTKGVYDSKMGVNISHKESNVVQSKPIKMIIPWSFLNSYRQHQAFETVPEGNTLESSSVAVAYKKYPKMCDNLCNTGNVWLNDPSWDSPQSSSTRRQTASRPWQ